MTDGIALIEFHVGRDVFAIIEVNGSCSTNGVPCKYNLVFPLNNLESHLNSEIGGHTSRKAVCIGLVEHMVLCGVCGLGFPLRIVRNLSSLAAIIVEDYATSLIDVGGGG